MSQRLDINGSVDRFILAGAISVFSEKKRFFFFPPLGIVTARRIVKNEVFCF